MIHRDIKPDNIWIDQDTGRVKILDFGIARTGESEADGFTLSGTVVGTPRYMSPEQATNEPIDHRTDLFSLGSVLYHLASGAPPFDGNNVTATLMAVSLADETPIAECVEELYPELAALIDRLLSRDPIERPQSAAEISQVLDSIDVEGDDGNASNSGAGRTSRRMSSLAVVAAATIAVAAIFFYARSTPSGTPAIEPVFTTHLVAPIAVTSSTAETDEFPAEQLIDASGFRDPLKLDNYEASVQGLVRPANAWCTEAPGGMPSDYFITGKTPELMFDLGSRMQVTHLVVWGYSHNGGSCNNEVKTIEVAFSADGGKTFNHEIVVSRQQTNQRCETLDLGGTHWADQVRLRITDNHFTTLDEKGGDRVGLSEVRFLALRESAAESKRQSNESDNVEETDWSRFAVDSSGYAEAYTRRVIDDSPIAYYPFDEPSTATSFRGVTGNDHHSTEARNVILGRQSLVGSGAYFDGNAFAKLDLTLDPSTTDLTIELLAYPTRFSHDHNLVQQLDGTGVGRTSMLINRLKQFGSVLGERPSVSTLPVTLGNWHHLAITVNQPDENGSGGAVKLYVNGQLVSDVRDIRPRACDGQWVLGAAKSLAAQFWHGMIDEVAIYDRLLTQEELAAHVNAIPLLNREVAQSDGL